MSKVDLGSYLVVQFWISVRHQVLSKLTDFGDNNAEGLADYLIQKVRRGDLVDFELPHGVCNNLGRGLIREEFELREIPHANQGDRWGECHEQVESLFKVVEVMH
jgi:hypothetical protein